MGNNGKQLGVFLALTFALSSVFYFLIIKSGHLGSGAGYYVLGLMWCPGLAGVLTRKLFHQDISKMGWKWGQTQYQIIGYLIPLVYASVAYVFVWISGLAGFPNHDFVVVLSSRFGLGVLPPWAGIILYLFFVATTGVIRSAANALGEEIGWRGFLVPQLALMTDNFTATALISAVIWVVWRLPALMFADFDPGTPWWYGILCFTGMAIGSSLIATWLRLKSGSLWTATLLLAGHNIFIQGFFDPISINAENGRTPYIIGDFGAALAIVCLIFGIYFWTRRGELAPDRK